MLRSVDEARAVRHPFRPGEHDAPQAVARLSRETLEDMRAHAENSVYVNCPKRTFCNLLTMAIEAAHAQPSPSFTLRELETMLFNSEDCEEIEMEGPEVAALVTLAMQVADAGAD
jgi:hypothetical protein